MHRSGSSAFTRTLKFLGLSLPNTLVASRKNDNDLGFWESQPQVDLNDEFLRTVGSHWYDFAPPDLDQVPAELKQDFVARAAQLIDDEFGDAPLFVMKDPRLCLLFPLWQEALQQIGIRTLCVLPIRNPLDIANSLHKRNRILQGESLVSWLRFMLAAECSTRDIPRVFVHYDDLLVDWRQVTDRISANLDLIWPNTSASAAKKIDTFLSDEWCHHHAGDAAVLQDSAMSPWIRDAYEIMKAWSQDIVAKGDRSKLDKIANAFDQSVPAYRRFAEECRALSVHAREFEQNNIKLQEEALKHRNAAAVALARVTKTEALLTEAKALALAEAKANSETLASAEALLAESLAHAQDGVRQVADDYQKRVTTLETEKATLVQEMLTLQATVSEVRKTLHDSSEEFSTRLDTYATMTRAAKHEAAKNRTAKNAAVLQSGLGGVARKVLNIPRRCLRVIKRLMKS
ncbi:sulfotransferase family protein [Shimia abyssi]|uniref:Sulfotransferase family protein n=1 Tax=Shimia abyssi TaxID=1662395 RepID=A0A2P8F7C6_9RHOB|nr:hypothetical protein [Shimia abyssi]PSL17618.1 hypothetical protein CLV88_11665 [Shimia abyssi]